MKRLKKLITHREALTTTVIILCCLVFFFLFPITDAFQNATALIVFFFLIPLLYLKLILKKDLRSFGWQMGDWKKGLFFSIGALLIFFGIFLLLFYKTSFTDYYALSPNIRSNFFVFSFYEFFQALLALTFFEFFFRGFIMFSFAKDLRAWSILVQFAAFLLLLLFLKSFNLQHLLLIFSAFFSGIITYQSRSLFYSYATTVLFIILCDAYLIKFFIQ